MGMAQTTGQRLDYVVIGHVTHDLQRDGGVTIGGTVTFAARTARAMGCRVGVVTSGRPDVDLSAALPDVHVHCVPAAEMTTFDNQYTPSGRVQWLRGRAASLNAAAVPPAWREASILHLGPLDDECDPALLDVFPRAFVGLTPQGWMRRWDESGRVRRGPWRDAEMLLPRADAVVLSEEDVNGDVDLFPYWARQCRLLVVTQAAAGCTIFVDGQPAVIPGFPADEVDPTGAGDIFAAVLFVRLWRGDAPWTAAQRANCVAAISVTRAGLLSTPSPEEAVGCVQSLD